MGISGLSGVDGLAGVNGASGLQGISGLAGGGGLSCPSHVDINQMSGYFIEVGSPLSPNIKGMFTGNREIGWSYGVYDNIAQTDGFGNIVNWGDGKNTEFWVGIPLQTDLLSGDVVKICGMVSPPYKSIYPSDLTFYITVSYFSCDFIESKSRFTTLIPVAAYPFTDSLDNFHVCFSESVVLNFDLPGCTTFLVVGMQVGSETQVTGDKINFTYTLGATQACIGPNMIISLCCDPEYTEIVHNNGLALGAIFTDTTHDHYCWQVVGYTIFDITGSRDILSSSYTGCTQCLADNPCPENYIVESCCGIGGQFFTSALPGVALYDTFVDSYGFCWYLAGTTPQPITNVVSVGTVYASTDCQSEACTSVNDCPFVIEIYDCCGYLGYGYTTEALLGITVTNGETFTDTFGRCWTVTDTDAQTFPNLNFIVASGTSYGLDACQDCVDANPCNIDYYYTVQNCCTEEIEVVLLHAQYGDGVTIGIIHTTGAGCYKVLSWSNTGTATITVVNITNIYADGCDDCISGFLGGYCTGINQCCYIWANQGGGTMTGYLCDGTFIYQGTSSNYCMSSVIQNARYDNQGYCCFTITNPSTTLNVDYYVTQCGGLDVLLTLEPLEESYCVSCVLDAKGPWTYTSDCIL